MSTCMLPAEQKAATQVQRWMSLCRLLDSVTTQWYTPFTYITALANTPWPVHHLLDLHVQSLFSPYSALFRSSSYSLADLSLLRLPLQFFTSVHRRSSPFGPPPRIVLFLLVDPPCLGSWRSPKATFNSRWTTRNLVHRSRNTSTRLPPGLFGEGGGDRAVLPLSWRESQTLQGYPNLGPHIWLSHRARPPIVTGLQDVSNSSGTSEAYRNL